MATMKFSALFSGCQARRPRLLLGAFLLATLLAASRAWAFPPAPHHLVHGMVRDEYGTPLNLPGTFVILETSSGVQLKTEVLPDLEPGVNYRLEVPMDSGLTARAYMPTALRPTVPFRLKVRVGNTTYLPIEMRGDFAQLGKPGKRTLVHLTLGEDANGDGLPDAWQRLVNQDIAQVTPEGDADGDGSTNMQEYLAGTYAFDPTDGFKLDIVRMTKATPVLEFLAITGRTYTVEGSSELASWTPLAFRIPAEGTNATLREAYLATDVRKIQIEVPLDPAEPPAAYFRLIVH